MQWIRIFVPILLIGLGILDFTKAVFSKSEDDMKKSRKIFKKKKNKIHLKNNNFVELCGIINLIENTGGEYK